MMKNIEVQNGDWRTFDGDEETKIAEVMNKLAERPEGGAVFVLHVDAVSIPEILVRVRNKYEDTIGCVVSNFGGCLCGQCDNDIHYGLCVADTPHDAQEIINAHAKDIGMVDAEDAFEALMNSRDENGVPTVVRQIAAQMAERLGVDPDEIQITNLDEDGKLSALLSGAKEPKRTVH